MSVRAVFFDIGETLVDETSQWGAWADLLQVPRLTLFGVLGGLIERGEHHRRVFEIVRPGLDISRLSLERGRSGSPDVFRPEDFYPDAVSCLEELRRQGYLLGLAGNQPEGAETVLAGMGLPVDIIASSARWGVEKPSPEFFRRIIREAGVAPREIAYVGDRLDNDILPARDAGLLTVFIRRGPWGYLHALRPEAALADLRIESLAELPGALRER